MQRQEGHAFVCSILDHEAHEVAELPSRTSVVKVHMQGSTQPVALNVLKREGSVPAVQWRTQRGMIYCKGPCLE